MKQATISLTFDTGCFTMYIDSKTAKQIALRLLVDKKPKANRNYLKYRIPPPKL